MYMENHYHQTFVVVHLMIYIHVKLTLFICYLFRLNKFMLKKVRDKTKKMNIKNDFCKTRKIKIKHMCQK